MLPSPLHPALVHFPIALMVLLPLVALVGLMAIQRGYPARRSWMVVVAFQGLLVLSAVVALKTGEKEEDRVEKVVAESLIGEHEEAAEAFLWAAALVLVVALAGLLEGRAGSLGRIIAGAGTLVVLALGVQLGSTGGELVYKHGAAQAYSSPAAAQAAGPGEAGEKEDDDD
ncbi:MAG: hypothetical protein IT369_02865 [Candidatus Latescibacteria bacterium]|nr:hypothetical protein [Candidatus Latescibacterota bacterium]